MYRSEMTFRRRAFFSATIVGLLLAFVATASSPCQAQETARHRTAKKKRSSYFVFYKLLETAEGGGAEPFSDGNAYWYGKGRFIGSRKIYELKVTLPANRKFPGFGKDGKFVGMGNINPTEMTYEISRNGKTRTIVFKGWASLVDSSFFLHDGTVDPVEGWPGAYACPQLSAPEGFSFDHSFDRNNVRMYGRIRSKWAGTQVNPCGEVLPSMGPKLVVGVLVFPKHR